MKTLIAGLAAAAFILANSLSTNAQCCGSQGAPAGPGKPGCCAAKSTQASKNASKTNTGAKTAKKPFEVKGATLLVRR